MLAQAEVLQRIDRLDEAVETYQALLDGDPQNGATITSSAWRCGRRGSSIGRSRRSAACRRRTATTAARVALVETAVRGAAPPDRRPGGAGRLVAQPGRWRAARGAGTWARYGYTGGTWRARARSRRACQLVDGEAAANELIALGDSALREALQDPGGTQSARLAALWRERPWTLV